MADGIGLMIVGIAARLESLAEPGAIYVSAAARDHIGNTLPPAFGRLRFLVSLKASSSERA